MGIGLFPNGQFGLITNFKSHIKIKMNKLSKIILLALLLATGTATAKDKCYLERLNTPE
jgi:hypothetical protein